jgi:uncharacterized membrane protein YdjX (TVP38/TMEM64 family)
MRHARRSSAATVVAVSARRRLLKLVAVIAVAFVVAALALPHSPHVLQQAVSKAGVAAPIVFALAWAGLTPALCSGTVFALAAGLAFGMPLGSLTGIVGATLGAIASFLIARRIAPDSVRELGGERIRRVQDRLERRGLLAVICARAAPGVPATLLNYACGLSRIRLRDFVAGSAIGGAPRIVAYVSLGASGGDPTSVPALVGLGLVGAMTLVAGLALIARRLRLRTA